MQAVTTQRSVYFEGLSKEAKARYMEKILFRKVDDGEAFSGVVPVEECNLVSYD